MQMKILSIPFGAKKVHRSKNVLSRVTEQIHRYFETLWSWLSQQALVWSIFSSPVFILLCWKFQKMS